MTFISKTSLFLFAMAIFVPSNLIMAQTTLPSALEIQQYQDYKKHTQKNADNKNNISTTENMSLITEKKDYVPSEIEMLYYELNKQSTENVFESLTTATTSTLKTTPNYEINLIDQFYINTKTKNTYENKYRSSILSTQDQNEITFIEKAEKIIYSKKKYFEKSESKQFGYDFFDNSLLSSETLNETVSPDYLLGPGDQIMIHIWGKLDQALELTISNEGTILVPKIGPIYLNGVRYANLKNVLVAAFSKKYININLSASIGKQRTHSIYILGNVKSPGIYNVGANTSLLLTLYKAKGIKKNGSLRNIQIIRQKKVIKTVDLYRYFIEGDQTQSITLESNDTIFIPIIGDTTQVLGQVKRPAIFEIAQNSSLYDLLQSSAGGFSPTYYANHISIKRIIDGDKKIIKDITTKNTTKLTRLLKNTLVKNGDIITISPILDTNFQQVSLEGAVNRPGSYDLKKSSTLKKLINNAEGFTKDAYLNKIVILRQQKETDQKEFIVINAEDRKNLSLKLKQFDIVKVYSKKDIHYSQFVSIYGPVQSPGQYQFIDKLTIDQLILLAGPLENHSYDSYEITRRTKNKLTVITLDPNNPKDVEEINSFYLQANDTVMVRYDQIKHQINLVELTGEVRFPGHYVIQDTTRISELITRAGGLMPDAFLRGAVFKRKTAKDIESQGKKLILEEEKKRIIYNQTNIGDSSTDYNKVYEKGLLFLNQQIDSSEGRVIVDFDKIIKSIKSNDNLVLEHQDQLYIPKAPTAVNLVGGIRRPSNIMYNKKYKLKDYIKRAGGFSDFADTSKVYVIGANGEISKGKKKIFPGDSIYVSEIIIIRRDPLELISTFAQILFNLASSYTVLTGLTR